MCRMLGVVSAAARSFGALLEQAPRSIASLSNEHPDGWGVAVSHTPRTPVRPDGPGSTLRPAPSPWLIHRSLLRAAEDHTFHDLASQLVGDLLLVHVRQKTHGPTSMANTHPFTAGRWVFAHNGKVEDIAFLERALSPARRAELRGETDSERLFAFLLTRFDAAGITTAAAPARILEVLRVVVRELGDHAGLGTASFLLSDGRGLFAHRRGAPLFLLQRSAHGVGGCPDCLGSPCIAVTTEPITDEAWQPLDDGDLVHVARAPEPRWERFAYPATCGV